MLYVHGASLWGAIEYQVENPTGERKRAIQESLHGSAHGPEAVDLLCRDRLKSLPLASNVENVKTNPYIPDRISEEPIQINGGHNGCRVSEQLTRQQLEPSKNTKSEDSDVKRRDLGPIKQEEVKLDLLIDNGNINESSQGKFDEAYTLTRLLKSCADQKDLQRGSQIHFHVVEKGIIDGNVFLGSALINMYAKCGALEKAQHVFDKLASRNVVSWNSLIGGYAQYGYGKEALKYYECMQSESICPTAVTFACALKACSSIQALTKGEEIHEQIVKRELLKDNLLLANSLIDMYIKCGALVKAQEVFDGLHFQDVVVWSTLLAGYIQHGNVSQAFNIYDLMLDKGVLPNGVTFTCMLKACSMAGAIDKGQEIHAHAAKAHWLDKDILVANAVIDMYVKCGALKQAKDVFDKLACRDVVSWTTLICGYVQHDKHEHALNCYKQMQLEGLCPSSVTFSCLAKACRNLREIETGKSIHAQILRVGLLGDIVVANSLIDMYSKCGVLAKAQQVFDDMKNQNVVSWTSLIVGYVDHKLGHEALKCFEKMQSNGFPPDEVTFACALKACSSIGAIDKGQGIHIGILQTKLLDSTLAVNALVDMYAKVGLLEKAQEVFDSIRNQDVISWNTLLAGYVQHECYEAATDCFKSMQREGFLPDVFTFACVLKICGGIGALQLGQRIHSEVVRQGLVEKDLVIGTSLVNMYANCGLLAEAKDVFYKLPIRNVVSWSAFMEGYAQLGKDELVISTLGNMIQDGGLQDSIASTIVLNTCSHRGLLERAQNYFEAVSSFHNFAPHLEHYNCMIDLFGRAGQFDLAASVIKEMPIFASLRMLHTLLGACKNWGYVKLGDWAFNCALQLEGGHGGSYVSMSNIYGAFFGREDEVDI